MEQIGPTRKNEKAERTEKSTLNPNIYVKVTASDRNPMGTYSLQFLTVFLGVNLNRDTLKCTNHPIISFPSNQTLQAP
jgi:hypothetical protein